MNTEHAIGHFLSVRIGVELYGKVIYKEIAGFGRMEEDGNEDLEGEISLLYVNSPLSKTVAFFSFIMSRIFL